MANFGILIRSWPLTLGVDTAGVIVEAGTEAKEKFDLKKGDYVFGCTRLGTPGYGAGQEYHLMDGRITMPKPGNISLQQAATIGVASLTASLGLWDGLGLEQQGKDRAEWVLILGGASSVGKAAIQLAVAGGYKVLATCSNNSKSVVQALGAETINYKDNIEAQLQRVQEITGGINLIFDAAATDDPVLAKRLFQRSTSASKLFSTTNDWSGIGDFEGGKTYPVQLGYLGQDDGKALDDKLERYIPKIVDLIKNGRLLPSEYHVVGSGGFEDVIKAYEYQQSGQAGSKKVIVKVQDE